MKNIHFVAHTHWDREWYFSVRDSYVLLSESFKRVVENLEENPESSFCIDGQSSIVEDFLNLNPAYEERVKKLIKEQRMFTGPWYAQTDALYVSGDSILQNLIYGKKYAQSLGHSLNVGYLPDTFGFNVQMPTILKNASIDNAVIRRGVDYNVHSTDSYFNWKGLSGKTVKTAHIYKGYGEIGQIFYDSAKEEKIRKYADTIIKYTDSDDILMESGGDQTEINQNFSEDISKYKELAKEYNLVNSNLEKFFNKISSYNANDFVSDFRIGSYDRVHRSIGSIRYDIKQENFKAENKIFNLVLPLMLIAKKHDIDMSYKLIDICFKKLFENQAHDSMGGCVTDEVYEDIMYRFKEVNEILDGIANTIAYRIHELGHYSEDEILVFSTKTKSVKDSNVVVDVLSHSDKIKLDVDSTIVKCEKVKDNSVQGYHYFIQFNVNVDLPALGYKVVKVLEGGEAARVEEVDAIDNGVLRLSNDNGLKVEFNGCVYGNVISFLDMGNEGDTYDFSYILGEIESEFKSKDFKFERIANKYTARCSMDINLPYSLSDRSTREKEVSNKIEVTITTFDNSEKLNVKLRVDNQALSHRLRIKFAFVNDNETHIQSVPFGFWEVNNNEELIEDWQNTHQEENLNLKVFDNLVSYQSRKNQVSFISYGSKEYEILNDGIAVTLFSSTGEFGRADLNTRPGRASGDTSSPGHKRIETPLAQYVGENRFEFDLVFTDSFEEQYQYDLILASKHACYSYQRQKIDKFLKRLDNKMFPIYPEKKSFKSFSLFELDLNVSYIDVFEDGYMVRVVNPTSEVIDVESVLQSLKMNVKQVDALGNDVEGAYKIQPNDFNTYILKP